MGGPCFREEMVAGGAVFCRVDCGADADRVAAGYVYAPCEPAIRDQRAGMGQLVWRSGERAGAGRGVRFAGDVAVSMDRAQMAAPLLVRNLAGDLAIDGAGGVCLAAD